MQAALLARLLAASETAASLGARISWFERPRSLGLPALTMTLVSTDPLYTHDGANATHRSRVQFDLWSDAMAAQPALIVAVRAAMERAESVSGVSFSFGWVRLLRQFAPEDLEGVGKIYRTLIDFEFYHEA